MLSFCKICQEEVEVHEDGGLFYCVHCNVQSEERVMEYDAFESQPSQSFSTPFQNKKKITVSRKATQAENKAEKEAGNSPGMRKGGVSDQLWWMAEGFQLILKAQVQALIDMGVTPKLKPTVKQLWFRFLKNSQWLYEGPAKLNKITKEYMHREGKEPRKGKKKMKVQNREKNNNQAWDKDGEFKKDMAQDALFLRSDQRRSKLMFRLYHLLCILYIALRWLGESILFTDLIRWVHEGHLPYYGNKKLFPESFLKKFSHHEAFIFLVPRPAMLHSSRLQDPMYSVLEILDVRDPIPPVSLRLVISRFILSLNLPASLHPITGYLLAHHPAPVPDTHAKWKIGRRAGADLTKGHGSFTEEPPSLAYIIVAIKLLVGLDDEMEYALSDVGRQIRRSAPSMDKESPPFIWDEWMAAQKLRVRRHQLDINHFKPDDTRHVRDVTGLVDRHSKSFCLESKEDGWVMKSRVNDRNLLNDLQRPFLNLKSDSNNEGSRRESKPSSFPYCTPREALQEIEGSVVDRGTQHFAASMSMSGLDDTCCVHWIPKERLLSADFSQHNTDYLLDLKKFCKEHQIHMSSFFSDGNELEGDSAESSSRVAVKRKKEKKRKRRSGSAEVLERAAVGDEGGDGGGERVSKDQDEIEVNDAVSSSIGMTTVEVVKMTRARKRKRRNGNAESSGSVTVNDEGGDGGGERMFKGKDSGRKKTKGGMNIGSRTTQSVAETNGNEKRTSVDEFEVLSYEQWKQQILAKVDDDPPSSSASSSSVGLHPSQNCSLSCTQLSCSGLTLASVTGANKRYVRYDPVKLRKLQSALKRDGEPSAGLVRPFHESYQWLLEHCAVLFGVDWEDIHMFVSMLEESIFGLR